MESAKTQHATDQMSEVVATKALDAAFQAVYTRRRDAGPHNDIWTLSLQLMGALMLKSLDACVPKEVFYVRYKTQSLLRRLVKQMHQVMHRLKFKLALDKTFIGRICKGFDFLGYRFNHTVLNFSERLTALYEQGASDQRIRLYIRRWWSWACSGGVFS